jgi:hypothetical protein
MISPLLLNTQVLLQAELAITGVELGLDMFCVESYVAIKESFENTMKNSLVEEAKPADREILEWNTVEKEIYGKWEYPKSFSLINLDKHLLDYSPQISHRAEADCLALLRITAVLGEKWLVWVQNNSSPFSST